MTAFGHACVRIERDGRRLVVDPGGFSDLAALDGADAVLVTHEHPDHLAVDAVVEALGSGATCAGPASAMAVLREAGAPDDRLRACTAGDRFKAAGLAVEVLAADHAEVHPDVPVPANVGYLVDGAVLHPGDCVVPPGPQGVAVLLVPVGGPWLRVADAVELVRAVRPQVAVPVHDAVLSAQGQALADRIVGGLGGTDGTVYRRLALGETLTLG